MSRLLMVSGNKGPLGDFTQVLARKNGNSVSWTCSGEEALAIIDREKIDTVVVDEKLAVEDGLTFVKKMMKVHPLVNCALISSLPMAEFHEATEGLGVFMQLPAEPGAQHAEKMLQLIESIDVLMNL